MSFTLLRGAINAVAGYWIPIVLTGAIVVTLAATSQFSIALPNARSVRSP